MVKERMDEILEHQGIELNVFRSKSLLHTAMMVIDILPVQNLFVNENFKTGRVGAGNNTQYFGSARAKI